MKVETIKIVGGGVVTTFIPENNEDETEIEKMKETTDISEIDGFQAGIEPGFEGI